MEVRIARKAFKQIMALDEPQRQRVLAALRELRANPKRGHYLKWQGLWSLRIGRYRAIYRIVPEEHIVNVLAFRVRKKAYRFNSRASPD